MVGWAKKFELLYTVKQMYDVTLQELSQSWPTVRTFALRLHTSAEIELKEF